MRAFTLLLLFAIGCAAPQRRVLTIEQAEAARVAVITWLECEDGCNVATVKQYGEAVVPMLRTALQRGAAPASVELVRLGLEERYDELIEYRKSHPEEPELTATKEQFVAWNIENVHAQYRVRAAQALAAIGTANARRALEEGLQNAERADVRADVRAAIETELKRAKR